MYLRFILVILLISQVPKARRKTVPFSPPIETPKQIRKVGSLKGKILSIKKSIKKSANPPEIQSMGKKKTIDGKRIYKIKRSTIDQSDQSEKKKGATPKTVKIKNKHGKIISFGGIDIQLMMLFSLQPALHVC